MDYAVGYDVGRHRAVNEDYYGICRFRDLEVFIIADGMGGHNAGNIASRTAVRNAVEIISGWDPDEFRAGRDMSEALTTLIREVNLGVYNYSLVSPMCNGMGTTFVVLVRCGGDFYAAWVGDSRVYGIRDGLLTQLSKDDSFVQMLVDMGSLTPEEARVHPKKNMITKAVGTESSISPSTIRITDDYDGFLLCSDGLTNMLTDEMIQEKLAQGGFENEEFNLDVICDALVKDANRAGGQDNISLILVRGGKK